MSILNMHQDSELCQDSGGVLVRRTLLFVSGDTCELADTVLARGGKKQMFTYFSSHTQSLPTSNRVGVSAHGL